jgi:hypothetical protein
METTVAEFLTRQSLSTYIDRSICCGGRDAKGVLRGMRCGSAFGRIGEDRCACGLCTELLRCMHGACIMCTAMHATVRVRKFVVNKISNGPGDDFLRAPIQIMTPSNCSHPTPTSRRQGSMLPGGQARRASARAVEFRTDRIDRTNYARLESAARAQSCLCAALARPSRCENRPLLYSALYRK